MRKLCPACITRLDHVVHPECIVCAGTGYLRLGDGAMSLYTPEVVSRAVDLSLEAAARTADTTRTLSDDRSEPIRAALDTLTAAGILAASDRPEATATPWWAKSSVRGQLRDQHGRFSLVRDAEELAADTLQQPLIPLDSVLADAGPYEYTEDDRPNARGLPLLSQNGYPSHLARVADPQENGRNTKQWVRERHFDRLRAEALKEAAAPAAAKKQRRTRAELARTA